MIATLSGTVAEKLADLVILDVRGVGYGLLVTSEDHGRLISGEQVKVYVYEHIRENSHDLFGFLNLGAKSLFEQLLNVNGIGPKMALSILNIGSNSALRIAIASADTKLIQTANGVGKRVAERVIIELKDKVGLEGVDLANSGLLKAEHELMKDEAVEALVSLGYSLQDAAIALNNIDQSLSTAERVKQGLRVRL
ncbi:MAG TPA: Holliday junction branch migration protein RuvA [Candidatus Dormibacteraeota bacterium]|nr:Holliday junction branch migration protein RuvA [Candidatus Dormibacteraeota bacterium]